jgi:hypothetical protein
LFHMGRRFLLTTYCAQETFMVGRLHHAQAMKLIFTSANDNGMALVVVEIWSTSTSSRAETK